MREEELKKEENWYLTQYELEIKDYDSSNILNIHCNYDSYSYTKEKSKEDFLFLEMIDTEGRYDVDLALTLQTAKKLSGCLLKVINYMEDK